MGAATQRKGSMPHIAALFATVMTTAVGLIGLIGPLRLNNIDVFPWWIRIALVLAGGIVAFVAFFASGVFQNIVVGWRVRLSVGHPIVDANFPFLASISTGVISFGLGLVTLIEPLHWAGRVILFAAFAITTITVVFRVTSLQRFLLGAYDNAAQAWRDPHSDAS